MESLERVCRAPSKIEVGHFGFICFTFVNMLFFLPIGFYSNVDEVFMTMVMNRSQQHGLRGQQIDDTRHQGRQSQKVRYGN